MRISNLRPVALGLLTLSATQIQADTSAANQTDTVAVPVQLVNDIGAAERVEAAAILRVLSQEVASASCHLSYGVDPTTSYRLLRESQSAFDANLSALVNGDADMNIVGAETRRQTLDMLTAIDAAWAPVDAAINTLRDNPQDRDALALIKAENETILDMAMTLTSEMSGQYSNPAELLQVDVLLLDYAGRQAMLTQKMAKVACEVWAGNRSEDRLQKLRDTMQNYDLILAALMDGMPSAGIKAAPTDEIYAALSHARDVWGKTQDELNQVLAGGEISEELKTALYTDLNTAMYEMIHIEHLYVAYAKHDYSAPADSTVKTY